MDATAGDVHDERQGPELLSSSDRGTDGVVIVDVTTDGDGPLAELLGKDVGRLLGPVEHDDAHPGADQVPDGGGAQASGAARHDRRPARELHRRRLAQKVGR